MYKMLVSGLLVSEDVKIGIVSVLVVLCTEERADFCQRCEVQREREQAQ